jgi:hypothetical protein
MLLNVGRYVEEHPEAAEAHYCLGRIHSYAFVHESAQLGTAGFGLSPEDPPRLLESGQMTLDDLAQLVASSQWQRGDKNTPEAQSAHLVAGLKSLRRALELAPERGAFHLTMAYVLERGAHLAAEVDPEVAFPLYPFAQLDGVRMGCKAWVEAEAAELHPARSWLGRVINSLGAPLDDKGQLEHDTYYPLNRPSFNCKRAA